MNSTSFHWIPVATAELWKPLEPSESYKHLRSLRPLFQSCIVDRKLWKPTTAYKRPSPLLYLAFYKQAIYTTHSVIYRGTASVPQAFFCFLQRF